MDLIDRQSVKELAHNQMREKYCGMALKKQRDFYIKLADSIIDLLPSAEPEIIRCKDCKYWVPGYITDNDDFIPPKCGEWQQMVGHSSDDYCSLAERREVTT
jgi:hypothetical protein